MMSSAQKCLAGGGELGSLLRSLDWSGSALGPVERWPQSLRIAVSICLNAPAPLLLWWGSELTLLYNDAARPLLADSHPDALAGPGHRCRPEIWQAASAMLRRVLETGEAASTHDLSLPDGTGAVGPLHWTLSHSPIREESGGVGGVLTLAAAVERRISEERYRDLIENANDVIYTLDFEGRIISINRRAEQTFGYTREECLGRCIVDFVPVEYRARLNDVLRRKLEGKSQLVTHELEVVGKDGRRVALEVSSRLIARSGQPPCIQGIARDITERKRTEQAQRFLAEAGAVLAASLDGEVILERLARLIVPTLADWCAIDILPEGRAAQRVAVVHTDPAAVPLGRDVLHLDLPEASVLRAGEPLLLEDITDDMLAARVPGAEQLAGLRRLGLRSGMVVPLSARGRVLGAITLAAAESGRHYDPGDLGLAVELARRAALAVDNAHLYRDLQEADRRKDEFLAMLAHELRNPLAPIRNAVQVLKLLGLAHPQLGQVRDMIDRQVAHLARLVDDLLDVSRITRGKILLRKEHLDLLPLVRTAVEDHRRMLEGTGLKLVVELPDRPLWVEGDPTRLAQVVGNLLHNASKFTDAGGRVAVRLQAEAGGTEAVLGVRDTGIGMDADMLRRLFEPFSQADRSIDRSRGGLGLGLALVKGLVELHGGSVRASSPGPGQGSEFIVRVPLSRATQWEAGAMSDRPWWVKSLRVLVIEDNWDAAESLRLLLELSGHEVVVTHNGAAGVEAARRQQPDVVLCDIGLPGGMDGYAVARALRADPEQSVATLIAVSGYGQEEDQRRARQAGFDRHLTKPVDPQVLAHLLEMLPARADR
jgi:PAS domain S-box-containing protein